MALNPSNSSGLEQLALKGLISRFVDFRRAPCSSTSTACSRRYSARWTAAVSCLLPSNTCSIFSMIWLCRTALSIHTSCTRGSPTGAYNVFLVYFAVLFLYCLVQWTCVHFAIGAQWFPAPSPPLDNIWAVMIVCRIRRKIIRTVLCCIV